MTAVAQTSIRLAAPHDDPGLRALYRSTRADELEAVGWEAGMIDAFCDLQYDMQQAHYGRTFPNLERRVVVDVADSVVGQVAVDRQPDLYTLVDISVLPPSRGRGLGTRLLGGVIEVADDAAVPVALTVSKGSPARSLYERHGFRIQASTDLHHHMRRPAAGKRAAR